MSGPLAPGLRGPVKDLASVRANNQLSLTWTMPTRGTGKLAVNGTIAAHVCLRESAQAPCTDVGQPLHLAPGATGSFSEVLTTELSSGPPRVVYYSVELLDRNGRPTGLSNSVATLAGAAPGAVEGLTAKMTPDGVLLQWTPLSSADDPAGSAVRLHRVRVVLISSAENANQNPAAFDPATDEKDLYVEDGARSGHVLDKEIRSGNTYEYSAQRVARFNVGGQTLELGGAPSVPVEIAVPNGNHP